VKCPKCQFENREGAKFCKECGNKLELACPQCGNTYTPGTKFCDECGHTLTKLKEGPLVHYDQPQSYAPESQTDTIPTIPTAIDGERKHVTVLFSDMSGYTAMSERLDPEDVKEITSRIFGRISRVIDKYEGFVERFIHDAVMALFGERGPWRLDAYEKIHPIIVRCDFDFQRRFV